MFIALLDANDKQVLYRGLRMSADEYFRLEDDGFRYELIDGVVCMSPSPLPVHQKVAVQLVVQIANYLEDHPVGTVFVELDVQLGAGPNGGDLVYRPDVVFLRAERVAQNQERIVGPPDLIVEVVSNTSRRYDNETKKDDYERCGVREYWIIDPHLETMAFYALREGRYVELTAQDDRLHSEVIAGFALDLERVRGAFRMI